MKNKIYPSLRIVNLVCSLCLIILISMSAVGQDERPNFWQNVQFGGGLDINFGNGFFAGSIAPSAIYNFNQYLSMGPGLIFSYQSDDFFEAYLYGGSWITLANPIPQIQLSAELEQVRVNREFNFVNSTESDDFWNTALFVGGGYRTGPVTIGIRYNVLFKENEGIYADAWAPFVRVYF